MGFVMATSIPAPFQNRTLAPQQGVDPRSGSRCKRILQERFSEESSLERILFRESLASPDTSSQFF
eukprot:7125047-Pyramimonas_sp.AAC.1